MTSLPTVCTGQARREGRKMMSTFDPLALKLALAPFVVFILILAVFIYLKNRS
jgi:hypothetical protein